MSATIPTSDQPNGGVGPPLTAMEAMRLGIYEPDQRPDGVDRFPQLWQCARGHQWSTCEHTQHFPADIRSGERCPMCPAPWAVFAGNVQRAH